MSTSGQITYGFRVDAPDVLQRAQAGQIVSMAAWHNGAQVSITEAGSTFTLLDPGGTAIVDAAPVTVDGSGAATYTLQAADLPSTAELSTRYQQRWSLVMPDGITRTVHRECAVARLLLYCPVVEADITGVYPSLQAELSSYADSLQGFIDEAWRKIRGRLWDVGQWPDLLLSTGSLREPTLQLALHLIFRELHRRTGETSRYESLMSAHREEYEAAWGSFTSRVDADLDGLPDSDTRVRRSGLVHRNATFNRRYRRGNHKF